MYRNHLPEVRRAKKFICRCGILRFPTVEALSQATEEELRGCGLGYRAKYIAVTARTIASGQISLEKIYDMRYHQAKKELMKLCGVGER